MEERLHIEALRLLVENAKLRKTLNEYSEGLLHVSDDRIPPARVRRSVGQVHLALTKRTSQSLASCVVRPCCDRHLYRHKLGVNPCFYVVFCLPTRAT